MKENKKIKILIIRLRSIGDMLLITPAIALLKKFLPESEITVISETLSQRMLTGNPHIDSVISIDRKRIKSRGNLYGLYSEIKLTSSLWKKRYDIVLDMYNSPKSAAWSWLSRAPLRFGFEKKNRSIFYTHTCPERGGTHTVSINIDLVKLAVQTVMDNSREKSNYNIDRLSDISENTLIKNNPLCLNLRPEEVAIIEKMLFAQNISRSLYSKIVVIHSAARFPTKEWSVESFTIFSKYLIQNGYIPVFTGTENDGAKNFKICENLDKNKYINLTGLLNLGELAALCRLSAFFVGNDSGPMHIAASQECRIIALFGPSDYKRWHPWSRYYKIVHAGFECSPCPQRECSMEHGCMDAISPEMVIKAFESQTGEIKNGL